MSRLRFWQTIASIAGAAHIWAGKCASYAVKRSTQANLDQISRELRDIR
jgi:hypothetical protein